MGRRRQPINQPRHCSILPSHGARDLHAVALVESAGDRVFSAHGKVKITASWLYDLVHELKENPATRAVELVTVENLVKHDRASGHQHITNASPFSVLLVSDYHAVLIDTLPRLDAAFQCILPNVRKHIPVGLEMPVDRLEVAETRVSHGYFLLKTKIGSLLKALFPMCFSPTILLS